MRQIGPMGIVLTLLGACILGPDGYVDYNGQLQEWPRKHYLIDVTTDPSGAPVNFDGEFVGRSPLKQLVPRSRVSPVGIRIEALPFQGGQFAQTTPRCRQARLDTAYQDLLQHADGPRRANSTVGIEVMHFLGYPRDPSRL